MQHTGVYHLQGYVAKPGQALRITHDVAEALGLHLVKSMSHIFPRTTNSTPGITVASIFEESHAALSTYPETSDVYLVVSCCSRRMQPSEEAIDNVFRRYHLKLVEEQWI